MRQFHNVNIYLKYYVFLPFSRSTCPVQISDCVLSKPSHEWHGRRHVVYISLTTVNKCCMSFFKTKSGIIYNWPPYQVKYNLNKNFKALISLNQSSNLDNINFILELGNKRNLAFISRDFSNMKVESLHAMTNTV